MRGMEPRERPEKQTGGETGSFGRRGSWLLSNGRVVGLDSFVDLLAQGGVAGEGINHILQLNLAQLNGHG